MINFLCKTFPYVKSSFRNSQTHYPFFLQYHPLSSSAPSSTTLKSAPNTCNEYSFTVNYLMNSCGLPPEKALSVSKYVNFETPDKPNSMLAFLKNHDFTQTQISNLVRGYPRVLLCDPKKTILPKLQFFTSQGVSSTDLGKILSRSPRILARSLENLIIPSFNGFKDLLQSNEKTISAITRFGGILHRDLQSNLVPKIEILRGFGVPQSNIEVYLMCEPRLRSFSVDNNRFKKIVEEVKEMGFNPGRVHFVLAIHVMRAMSKVTWKKKVDLYKKWGWSENEIFTAFGKYPLCMMASEDKITRVMDYLINKMGWQSSSLAGVPVLVTLSLEKRIIPRCLVYQVLRSKGLIKKEYSLRGLLASTEKQFLKHIEKRYEKEAPELLRLYQENLTLSK